MAKSAASGPFDGIRKRLLYATGIAAAIIATVAMLAGVIMGFNSGLDLLFGALIVLIPSFWVALSLTAHRPGNGAVWVGLARYTLAAIGFAVLFVLRPSSAPVMVLLGSIMALLLPPIALVWQQRGRK